MTPLEGALHPPPMQVLASTLEAWSGRRPYMLVSQPATNASAPQSFQVQFTVPPSNTPGADTVQIVQAGGVTNVFPLFFSYGSSLVSQPVQAVPPVGGATIDLFGYGLGVDLSNFNTSVAIGGQNAPVTSHSEGVSLSYSYPFPIQHLQVSVPAGSSGFLQVFPPPSPVAVQTSSERLLRKAVRYLQEFYPAASADSLSALTYDASRNRLYLAAGDHVDVFDLGANSFLTPIPLPSLKGSKKATGLTVTPDDSKLLVSNQSDGSIGVIDLNSPFNSTAVTIPFTPLVPDPNCSYGPVTNRGV